MRTLRRAIFQDFIVGMLRADQAFDLSFAQVATLITLETKGELSIKQIAEQLGRSLSATSRLIDQLVVQGLLSRREDKRDRRTKQVALTEHGRALIAQVEQRRADAQIAVMAYLSPEEQAQVLQAMLLLAEAGKRKGEHDVSPATESTISQSSCESKS
ncbi:MarR family winged helix-turn-helix transcriptional regulator [Ktedonobacter racemifer]|uniref:Transcriptional regulator, MarR family n=1 Tax=Ktedonobacter racemifer DSM 44963 TaxID=485913 RepID=D6TS90_KTERA|nr:MarR family transcriptional regulator [Ktedonobacter racemifer]EFH83291.1 transcriptional regulator, MarR family [Ktedonobacter racemifer DSM 44963]